MLMATAQSALPAKDEGTSPRMDPWKCAVVITSTKNSSSARQSVQKLIKSVPKYRTFGKVISRVIKGMLICSNNSDGLSVKAKMNMQQSTRNDIVIGDIGAVDQFLRYHNQYSTHPGSA